MLRKVSRLERWAQYSENEGRRPPCRVWRELARGTAMREAERVLQGQPGVWGLQGTPHALEESPPLRALESLQKLQSELPFLFPHILHTCLPGYFSWVRALSPGVAHVLTGKSTGPVPGP